MTADVFQPYRAPLEAALKAALPKDPSPLSASVRYVMGWEDAEGRPSDAAGKRLRPLVTCHIAALLGAPLDRVVPGAVAIELVHNFSLVHDEIQDQDDTRHGRPTLWARLGTAQAINAGDLLFTRAFAALAAMEDSALASSYNRVLTSATEQMIRGQWQDLSFEDRTDVSAEEYLEMVAGKTGALIGACGAIAALAAGRDEATVAAFQHWGVSIGLAFQAQDDYLGVWGNSAQTGKSNTNDIARRKKSLPVLLGLGDPDAAPIIRSAFEGDETDTADVRAVVASLDQAGIGDQSLSMARRFQAEAEELLAALPDTDARTGLVAMGRLLVERER
jgi:geranylgeranyl diphosphate synthase type I